MNRQRVFRGAARSRRTAWLGIWLMLFQAVLFGWHHHDHHFGTGQGVAIVSSSAGHIQPVDDEDGCEICIAIHHQAAAPAVFFAALSAALAATSLAERDAGLVGHAGHHAFRPRAPPRV